MHNVYSKRGEKKVRRGFALVIVLSLMLLVSVLALGMLSLSTVTLRTSQSGEARAVARANARMALMMAVNELQKNLGPDTRATAPAGQLKNGSVPNPDWIAAYDTRMTGTEQPVVGRDNGAPNADQNWSTDARIRKPNWRDSQRTGWLVSGEEPDPLKEVPSNKSVTVAKLLSADGSVREVKVPKVELHGADAGSYAYWVSDESAKARLDLIPLAKDRMPDLAHPETLVALQSPARHNAAKTEGFEWHGKIKPEEAAKLVSLKSSQILQEDRSAAPIVPRRLGDFTTDSATVLSNPRNGGLKLDLGAYLSIMGESAKIDLSAYKLGQLADTTPMIPGFRYNRGGGPVLGMLRGWTRLSEDISGNSANPVDMAVTPRFPATRQTTRTGAFALEGAAPALTADKLANVVLPSGKQTTGMPVHPLMTHARFSLDFVYQPTGEIVPLIYPWVVLWNPYNAKLAAADYVVVMPLRATSDNVQVKSGANVKNFSFNSMVNPSVGGGWDRQYFCFSVPGASFGPGEARVFVPDTRAANAPVLGGVAGQYSGTDISRNKLTSDTANALGGAFYFRPTQSVDPSWLGGTTPPTIRFSQQMLFQVENWLLKGSTRTMAVSSNTLLDPGSSSANFPTLQSYYPGLAGGQAYQSGVDEFSNAFSSGVGLVTLRPAQSLTRNIMAPAALSRTGRWMDFDDNNPTPQNGGMGWVGPAWASDYNPRAALNCRHPLSFSGPYYTRMTTPWTAVQPTIDLQTLANTTGSNGDAWITSPFWQSHRHSELPERVVFFDVPHPETPLLSVARLRHASLSRYMWHSCYAIGHSQISALAETDSSANRTVAAKSTTNQWGPLWTDNRQRAMFDDIIDPATIRANQNLIFDLAFEVNQSLFDDFFVSGIRRSSAGEAEDFDREAPSANPLMMMASQATAAEIDALKESGQPEEVLSPAALLLLKGGFNVNSTSIEAWKAVLSAMREIARPLASGGASEGAFSRVNAPWLDGRPSSDFDDRVFEGFAALDDPAIDRLAKAIVTEVRRRGPFLTMGDFVNRRMSATVVQAKQNPYPLSAEEGMVRMGALDAAIEHARINGSVQTTTMEKDLTYTSRDPYTNAGSNPPATHRAQHQSLHRNSGMPGVLTQGDILEALGASLTTRGDTFVVRAYGEARAAGATGEVLARAWCEAVVQRTPRYLISNDGPPAAVSNAPDRDGNQPFEPAYLEEWASVPSSSTQAKYRTGKWTPNSAIHPLNKRFGRKLEIVSFRWISQAEMNS